MNNSCLTRFAAFVLDVHFKTVGEALGEVEGPEEVLAGKQSVEHDVRRGRVIVGNRIFGRKGDVIVSEFSLDRGVLKDIVFHFGINGM